MKRIIFFFLGGLSILFNNRLESQSIAIKQYIELYKNIAMKEMIAYQIPASITLAQGLLESGSGNSRLAKSGNNHFGIKCKKDWTGCTILEDDDDLQECFRCYTTVEESYKDHSKFLHDNRRYANLFNLEITDYQGWAAGLLAAGYATNQKYTDLLISCIERNKLAQYDTLVVNGYNPYDGMMPANIEIVNTRNIPVTIIQPNQTLETIAEKSNKSEKKLEKYNDLSYHKIEPGDVIYLKPKKRKAGVATHTVAEGEDMWLISQKYAIRLNSLYKKNLMDEGTEPATGVVLQLQHKAAHTPDTFRAKAVIKKADVAENIDYHTVKSGETVYSISKLYQLTVEELKKMNQLNNNQLVVGQKLRVKGLTKQEVIQVQEKIHVVKAGDTLYSISKLYQKSVEEIKKANNLNSDALTIGQNIVIP